MHYTQHLSTPQTEPLPGQTKNNAGGYSYQIDKWQQLRRFLILGSERGTYYVSERKLTRDNAQNVIACIQEDGARAIGEIVGVSERGNAPKNDPAIFALALACTYATPKHKLIAYDSIRLVCRTGTHLFSFCQAIQDLRGWSRGLRRGVAEYYEQDPHKLAYQLIKYRQRNGWTHKDVVRLAHPKVSNQNLAKWLVGKPHETQNLPSIIQNYEWANRPDVTFSENAVKQLPWEALPTEWLKKKEVWDALIPTMPLMALMRNLNKLSLYAGVDSNLAENTKRVADRFTMEAITKARLHPLKILEALKTYGAGRGYKGSLTWKPAPMILQALEAAFYHAFGNVETTGKSYMIGLDISGSMTSPMSGSFLSCAEAAAALLMILVRSEKAYEVIGFDTRPKILPLTPNMSLAEVMRICYTGSFGQTDCSVPIAYASASKRKVEVFQILTDNETYAGRIHPAELLQSYRGLTGIDSKMVVWGMTSTGFSIADPNDKGMLDVVGFDTSVPELLKSFIQ